MSDWRGWTLHANQPQGEPVSEPSRLFVGGSLDLASERRWVLWNMPRGEVRSVEVMPISEHEEEMDFLRRARDNAEQAWAAAEEERDRLRQAAQEVLGTIDTAAVKPRDGSWEGRWKARGALERLRAAVNPQEDER